MAFATFVGFTCGVPVYDRSSVFFYFCALAQFASFTAPFYQLSVHLPLHITCIASSSSFMLEFAFWVKTTYLSLHLYSPIPSPTFSSTRNFLLNPSPHHHSSSPPTADTDAKPRQPQCPCSATTRICDTTLLSVAALPPTRPPPSNPAWLGHRS